MFSIFAMTYCRPSVLCHVQYSHSFSKTTLLRYSVTSSAMFYSRKGTIVLLAKFILIVYYILYYWIIISNSLTCNQHFNDFTG